MMDIDTRPVLMLGLCFVWFGLGYWMGMRHTSKDAPGAKIDGRPEP